MSLPKKISLAARVPERAGGLGELAARFAARESAHDREGVYAQQNVEELRRAGLLTLTVPATAGGMGARLAETLETLRTLAAGAPSTALMLAMHTSILANYLLPAQAIPESERAYFNRQKAWAWNEALAGKIFAVANSEPGAGGDVHRSRAVVRPIGPDRWVMDGVKSFVSFGTHADYFMATGRVDSKPVDYYLVRNDPQSVQVESGWDAMGMRSSESVVLRFTSAPVLGPLAYRGMLDGVNNRHWSTLSFTAIFVGAAEALLEQTRQSAEGMLQKVETVNFHLTVQACRAFLRHCAEREPVLPDAAYRSLVRDCKSFVTRALARDAVSLFGSLSGRSFAFSSAPARLLRDLLAGPALRPPLSAAFDSIGEELGMNQSPHEIAGAE